MHKKNHWIILSLSLALILMFSACASAAPQPASTGSPPTQAPTMQVASPTSPLAPTAVPTEPAETSTPAVMTFTDGLGRKVTLNGLPQRIVSLAPSNTEILFAIGAGSQVVGRDDFSDYPEQAAQVADIGGGFGKLDEETIVSLKPDLILAADITPAEQVKALEDLGLTVYQLSNPTTLEGLYTNLQTVAEMTGHEAETEQLIGKLKERVKAVEDKISTVKDKPTVFYELDSTDPNAPYTSGPGTFIDTLINMSGGSNLGSVLDSAWAQISLEELVTKDPNIIVLGDYTWGGITPEDVAKRAGWESLSAVKDGKVYTFDDNLVSRPGPRMVDGLEAMAKLLHPELFK
jgi:iron complex transport system substrate-binding protein